MDRRRFLVTSLAAAFATPISTEAQQAARPAKVGYLASSTARVIQPFRAQLRERGWIEDENLTIVFRLWAHQPERVHDLARELVAAGVDIILAVGPDTAVAAKQATTTIPIVMLFSADPVRLGLVQSLTRPGGNVTGVLWDTGVEDYTTKAMEIFTTALPAARMFAAVWNLDYVVLRPYVEAAMGAAIRLGRRVVSAGIRASDDLEAVFRRIKADGAEALIVYADPLTSMRRDTITALAVAHRLPMLVTADLGFRDTLIVFGPHVAELPARAADFVDRILRGSKPSDLSIEQPAKYDLEINLRIAQVLRVTIPLSLLLRADHVIE